MLSRYLIYVVAFVAVAILIFIRARNPMPVESLRHRQFDLFQNMKPREKTQLPIVIVDVDEESLAAFGQWPWPRTLLARLSPHCKNLRQPALDLISCFPKPTALHLTNGCRRRCS